MFKTIGKQLATAFTQALIKELSEQGSKYIISQSKQYVNDTIEKGRLIYQQKHVKG